MHLLKSAYYIHTYINVKKQGKFFANDITYINVKKQGKFFANDAFLNL